MEKANNCLPKQFSDDIVNQLLLSIGLPRALNIASPKVTAEYHSIYKITIPENDKTVHTELVLRISGRHLPKIKTDNEVAVMTWISQNTCIPIPDLVAFDNSDKNAIGHEYTLLSLAEGTTLSEIYQLLTEEQLHLILDQLADYLDDLHSHQWNAIGGLRLNEDGTVFVDRIVDETFWQTPDVEKLWPAGETVNSLNLHGPYVTYIDLISDQVKTYIHLIEVHESLAMMRDAIPRLNAFVDILPKHADNLNNVKLCLAHKDLHFANILCNADSGKITSILDWEFSGVVPLTKWNPMKSFLWNGRNDEASRVEKTRLLDLFEGRCKERGLHMLDSADYSSPLQESMQKVADFLRAITEVVPRGQRAELVEGWKRIMFDNMAHFGV